ncbi:MAG: single-stranded-DNA-specific exonuclease RecJ [Alphaproteobacteria bacterium]
MNPLPPPFPGAGRSLNGRCWRLRQYDERIALAIAQGHDLPELLGRVMAGRGVTIETAESFLNPSLQNDLPDPASLISMDRAAKRLADAIMAGEKIAVFGDYDVDGATSAALIKRYLAAIGVKLTLYIPDRITEGYGPNTAALSALAEQGVRILITVDCGTLAYEALAAGTRAGLDIIVVDHHQADASLPDAYAVINPNRLDDCSGHGQLAAVGVAFLLLVALNRSLRISGWYAQQDIREPNLLQWLDLVALGTICDVAPLTGVNRVLVRQGLKVMARRRNPGLRALADVAGVDTEPTSYHAGFVFGPRINAGGRVGKSDLGARLLSSDDADETGVIAAELDLLNRERQAIEALVLEAALALAQARNTNEPLILVAGKSWHPGVIGIAASRLKDRFNLPVLVIGVDEQGIGKGSGRSITGVDLGSAVIAAHQAGLLINGGGHKMAAGLTVEAAKIEALRSFLINRIAAQVDAATDAGDLVIDGTLAPGAASVELIDALALAGPFGAGNPEPRFVIANASVVNSSIVGVNHVRCVLATGGGQKISGIAFGCAEAPLGQALLAGMRSGPLHVAGKLRADLWRGVRRVQLHVEDACPANQ